MAQTLAIVPSATSSHATSYTSGLSFSAPSAPGVHDTLRASLQQPEAGPYLPSVAAHSRRTPTPSTYGAPSAASTGLPTGVTSSHPLESRLALWTSTQNSLRAQLWRRQFGLYAPVMRALELRDCAVCDAVSMAGLKGDAGSGAGAGAWGQGAFVATGEVHADILSGNDWDVGGWEGVFRSDPLAGAAGDGGAGFGAWHAAMERRLGVVV